MNLAWRYSHYLLPYLLSGVVSIALMIYGWRERHKPCVKPFLAFISASFIWVFGNAVELGSIALETKIFWSRVEYFGIATLSVAWFAFALAYTGRENWLSRRNLALLLLLPALTLILVWTNGAHGLMRSDEKLANIGPLSVVIKNYGPGFWAMAVYNYILNLLGLLLILQSLRSRLRVYESQTIALLISVLIPWTGSLLYVFHLTSFRLDLTPALFGISDLVFAWAIFRYRLLDLIPIARDAVLEAIEDGVIVLDKLGRIVDFNPAAQRDLVLSAALLGQRHDVLPFTLTFPSEWRISQSQLNVGNRQFEQRVTPLVNRQKGLIGWLILLRDMTEQTQFERERELLIEQLKEALSNVKLLSGLLPICASCKMIRSEQGQWKPVEIYIREHSEAEFTHSICPDCFDKLYPDVLSGLAKK